MLKSNVAVFQCRNRHNGPFVSSVVVSTFGGRPHAAFVDMISFTTRRFITDNPFDLPF
jgi:hypothetical protein